MPKLLLSFSTLLIAILFLAAGCKPILNQNQDQLTDDTAAPTVASDQPNPTEVTKPGSEKHPIYEDFTQAKFEAALAAGEPIYLWFWATWCPTCRAQAPINEHVFNSYNGFVHVFRVNILDNNVDADEDALAKTYNVARQHTSILIDKNGTEAKRTIGTRSNTQLINDLESITK